jgi:hypothetical protein
MLVSASRQILNLRSPAIEQLCDLLPTHAAVGSGHEHGLTIK